jgi:hypothetical protein
VAAKVTHEAVTACGIREMTICSIKKGKLFHTNVIFRVDHRDGSSRVRVEGWELYFYSLFFCVKKAVSKKKVLIFFCEDGIFFAK